MGYRRIIFDPYAFISKDGFVFIDVVDKILYSRLENKKLWSGAIKLNGYSSIIHPTLPRPLLLHSIPFLPTSRT